MTYVELLNIVTTKLLDIFCTHTHTQICQYTFKSSANTQTSATVSQHANCTIAHTLHRHRRHGDDDDDDDDTSTTLRVYQQLPTSPKRRVHTHTHTQTLQLHNSNTSHTQTHTKKRTSLA